MLGKYLYGIIEEPQPTRFSFSGVGDAEVYTVNHQKLAAVVSKIEFQEVDPTRKNVRAHTTVQDELFKEYTLLPMGFGMIASSEDEVKRLLEKNHDGFIRELKRLAGKIEVGLKVFWDREAMVSEIEGENQEFANLKAKINAASSPIEAQNLLVEAGKLVERIATDWKHKYARAIYATLEELSVDARLNDPLGIKNILNGSFLIDKSRGKEFQGKVYQLDSKYQGKVNFKYVGPLPPYSFVNVKLEPVK
jgi:hypothetical protein